MANLSADATAFTSPGPIGSGSHAAAIAFSREPASKAKRRRLATAGSLHARGLSLAHVPGAPEKLGSRGQRWAYALRISSVVNSRAVVPLSQGCLAAGSSTRTTSMGGGVS